MSDVSGRKPPVPATIHKTALESPLETSLGTSAAFMDPEPPAARPPPGGTPPSRRPVADRTGDARLLCALLVALVAATAWSRIRAASAGPAALPVHPWRVDVNRADVDELGALPGVGPALAARIAAARREAPFRTAADLRRVPGIGPVAVERIAPHVRFGR